jgi:putative transposase
MKRFKSAGQAQRFRSIHDQGASLFRRSASTSAVDHRKSRAWALVTWVEATLTAGF